MPGPKRDKFALEFSSLTLSGRDCGLVGPQLFPSEVQTFNPSVNGIGLTGDGLGITGVCASMMLLEI